MYEPRTVTDGLCTEAQYKQSLQNGISRRHSNHLQSNMVISLTPTHVQIFHD